MEGFLDELATHEPPFVVKLARAPGARESRWAHLLAGAVADAAPPAPRPARGPRGRFGAGLSEVAAMRVEQLRMKCELERLRAQVARLARELGVELDAAPERPTEALADRAAALVVPEQLERILAGALAVALAAEQLGLRLDGQVGDVDDVLRDQRVDHVLDHADEVGVERGEGAALWRGGAEEGAHVGVVVGQELGPALIAAMQAVDGPLGVAADERHRLMIAARPPAGRGNAPGAGHSSRERRRQAAVAFAGAYLAAFRPST